MSNEVHVKFIAPKRWYQQARWELLKPYTSLNGNVTVTKGYISDGATIPWIARIFFSPTGAYFPAAIVHDYCITEERNWKKANDEFKLELKALGIGSFRRLILNTSVRIMKCWVRLTS